LQCFFEFDFGIPNKVFFRVVFFNTTMDPIDVSITIEDIDDDQLVHVGGDVYRLIAPLIIPATSRVRVSDVVVDPDLPIKIQSQFRTEGWVADTGGPILGMNIFATSNPEGDPVPYAVGDSFMKIEWWSS